MTKRNRVRGRNKADTKSIAMVGAIIVAGLLMMVYISAPMPVQMAPQVYAYGTITVFYKDGSTEVIKSPRVPLEKAAISLQDFFKSLSLIERGRKEVARFDATVYVDSSAPAPAVMKAQISTTLNGKAISSTQLKKTYVITKDPIAIWQKSWTAEELKLISNAEQNELRINAEVYAAFPDGVYRANVELKVDYSVIESSGTSTPTGITTVITASQEESTATVSTAATTATSSTTSSSTNTYNGMYVPQVQGMSTEDYVKVVEEFTGKPYTDQITVQTRDGGYQPTPGTLAAQDQYAYDVTDLFLTLRSTGSAPSGWTSYYAPTGHLIYVNEQTGSQVVISSPPSSWT